MVRIEEMLNYFRYQSVIPDTEKFRISCELMPAAQNGAAGQKKLLYINVQGKEEVKQRQNIVLLLDVSGSMCINTYQVQAAVATIISKLNAGDKISLVTYSSRDEVILRGFTIKDDKDKIKALEKFLGVNIYGCTNGSAGIVKAYEIGKEEYIEGGNNQVILITDGDLNFGITDKGGLTELIEEQGKNAKFKPRVMTYNDMTQDPTPIEKPAEEDQEPVNPEVEEELPDAEFEEVEDAAEEEPVEDAAAEEPEDKEDEQE